MAVNSFFFDRIKCVHFVGIGGMGMSGIAEVLLNLGFEVHGSDLAPTDVTRRLEKLGAVIHFGHHEKNLNGAHVVVTSTAVKGDNPEVLLARHREIPVIPRAEMLAELMRFKNGIAIAGSHGKTTTTSLVAAILQEAQMDPTVVIGGKLNHMGANACLGQGPFMVAEADESDGSFLFLSPCVAVITNLDAEHLNYFKGGIPEIKEQFIEFAHRLPFYGLLVACADSPHVRDILPHIQRRHITYGFDSSAQFYAKNIIHDGFCTGFEAYHKGDLIGLVRLNLVGRHNVLNALAAIAVGHELGISFDVMKVAFEHFSGVSRRFSLVGEANGIAIIDDYGHHPTEIQAVLAAAKVTFPGRRLVVLFQPHRYSRTEQSWQDFLGSFNHADLLVLTDIYGAGEPALQGVTAEKLMLAIKNQGHNLVCFGGSLEDATRATARLLKSGDVVITLGAGSITKSAPRLLELIRESHESP